MGNTNCTESMKGKSTCSYTSPFHNHRSHIKEVDKCDNCKEEKLCYVTCDSPYRGDLHRKCEDCRTKDSKNEEYKYKYQY